MLLTANNNNIIQNLLLLLLPKKRRPLGTASNLPVSMYRLRDEEEEEGALHSVVRVDENLWSALGSTALPVLAGCPASPDPTIKDSRVA